MSIESFLRNASYQARDEELKAVLEDYQISGRLADAAVGSIRVVKKTASVNPTASKKTLKDSAYVRKNIRLDEQNIYALLKVTADQRKLKTARGLSAQDVIFWSPNRREVAEIIRSATEAHQAIAQGIVDGDAEATVAAVQCHLNDVEKRMIERLV